MCILDMNKQQAKQHIKRMEAIMKAIKPFEDEDRSCDFADAWNGTSRIHEAYRTAESEIKFTKEEYGI